MYAFPIKQESVINTDGELNKHFPFLTVLFCQNLICQKLQLTANKIILSVSFKLMHWKMNVNWKEILPDVGKHFWDAGISSGM